MAIKDFYPAVRPTLDLNFAGSGIVDPRITFSRSGTGNVASYFDEKGVMSFAPSNVPRIDFDPVTGECLGLLMEEQRTNLLLNSAALSTQNVTVSSTTYTISFYGTGTISLSNAASETLVGVSAADRVQLTFAATTGTLTVTVSGSCTKAQLEVGQQASTYIPTTSAQVTRSADVMSITGSNFSSFFNANEGTVVIESEYFGPNTADLTTTGIVTLSDGAANHFSIIARTDAMSARGVISPGSLLTTVSNNYPKNTSKKIALAYKNNDFGFCIGGEAVSTNNTNQSNANINSLIIGAYYSTANKKLNGRIKRIAIYNRRIANVQLQALTA